MKMAKAGKADLEMAIELSQALEAISSRWGAVMPEKIERPSPDHESEPFSIDDHEDCRRVLQYLIRLTRSASLMRVVYGMMVLLDPRNKIVDPDADTLERHPDLSEPPAPSAAARDVLAERRRQIDVEGWTPAHDDKHAQGSPGDMAFAAACYATADAGDAMPAVWPWERAAWKPRDTRRNLVRAAALLLVEIERLDRAATER